MIVMFYNLHSRPNGGLFKTIDSSYQRLVPKQVAKDGILCKSFIFEPFNPSDELSKFSVNDFKLENIIALGAYDMLKPKSLTDCNPLSVIDKLESDLSESLNSMNHVPQENS